MIQFDEVKQLLEQANEPTLTLYLNTDAQSSENINSNPGWRIWVKNTMREMDDRSGEGETGTWADVRARAQQFFDGYQPTGKAAAILINPSFERSFDLPFAMDENRATFGRPNVMPLLWALDEYEPYLIALVDQNEARFFMSYLGTVGFQDSLSVDWDVGEGRDFTAFPSNHDVGRGGSEDAVKDRLEEHVTRMYRDVVTHLQKLMDRYKTRRIVLGGSEQAAHHVRNLMPEKMTGTVVAVMNIPIHTDTLTLTEMVQPAALDYERQQEENLVKQVIDFAKAGGRGAIGWKAVRDALDMQRVELLILPWPLPDEDQATDLILKTFASGGKVELVHGEAAATIGGEGGAAARLYYAL